MKQHTLRFLAQFALAYATTFRLLSAAARRTHNLATLPQRFVGKWRLFLNYCPECKSCAPKMHQCEVCNADTRAYFNWNKDVEQTWWKRYAEKHHLAA